MTKAIIDIAAPLGIAVHDHIIVGKNGHASLKGMQLILILRFLAPDLSALSFPPPGISRNRPRFDLAICQDIFT
jgi:hypothetical protein